MTRDDQPGETPPFAAFLGDFYAECDEHLAATRQALLALEESLPAGRPSRGTLDELFRSFHSLKGLAGMVGLTPAEQLAHHLEGVLRPLRQGGTTLTPATLHALLAGTHALDQAVAAHRTHAPQPSIDSTLEELVARAPSPEHAPPQEVRGSQGQGLTADEQAQVDAALARGGRLWSAEFTPSPELAARDVNVNTVRARLQERGELIRVTPRVSAGGGITFAFLLAATLGEAAATELAAYGVALAPYQPSPPAQAPAPPPPAPIPAAPSHVVRVDLERLDELLHLVGELVITRARLATQLEQLEPLIPRAEWRALQETSQALTRRLREIRGGVVRVRMVPIGEAFARVQFVARDLARELGKQVQVELHGQETEIDKFLIERMRDPLLHLVRNAVDHGLERPDERAARDKRPGGTILLRAVTAGDTVTVEIGDDGRGIDPAPVAARARELGLIEGDAPLDADQLLDLLCAPGLSTRAIADRVSGRGVGLDVVRTAIRDLGGTLSLRTSLGQGTQFRIALPLTLLVVDALLVAAGGQTFAVPLSRVREVVEVDPERVVAVEGREITLHRGCALPLLRLARRFGLDETTGARYAFVAGESELVGVVVDRLLGKREIVVRPIADSLGQTPGIGGATELGDGRPVLIIDVPGLLARAG
ncbi:MAG: hypothetical protein RLZZ387_4878 [Chloroflexota bacterium]